MRYIFYGLIMVMVALGCSPKDNEQDVSWEDVKKDVQDKKVLTFIGDSLTAGYQLPKECAFPYLVGEKLAKQNAEYITRNAGKSGAVSDDVSNNLKWYLRDDVNAVFLCIGANDGLRGKKLDATRKNIETIVAACRDKKIRIALAGIMLPVNYGEEYRTKFYQMYIDISKKYSIPFMPFLLKDVAGIGSLNLEDAIHPNAEGHKIIADNVFNFIMKENLLP
ncbi:arylesterase [Candidatus Uabimicrobium amorphum]|uniref:Arylesterase n=1 Tax=Uabimicrobium amorphum TaxID=2596890 RepID=A0A5S9F5E9_UABAM|nr:arylesterase [Candidatus Uabimicrobium amorphum]BBM86522.1 arylesterase [Candidatus Uabimicrobium amorphum]